MSHECPKCKQMKLNETSTPTGLVSDEYYEQTKQSITTSDEVDGNMKMDSLMIGRKWYNTLLFPQNTERSLNVSVSYNPLSRDQLVGACKSLLHIIVHVDSYVKAE